MLSYIGPGYGQGIRVYYDGVEVEGDTSMFEGSFLAGDGRIVVGRLSTEKDENYLSV